MKPAEKAAATRRIRNRAKLWRDYVRPEISDLAERLDSCIEEATRPTWSRPPLSREAIAWHQMQHLVDCYRLLTRLKETGGTPGAIGGLRAAREGMALLLERLNSVECKPEPTRLEAIGAGDLIQVEGKLERVAEKLRDGFRLEDGRELFPVERETVALQPADARQYREEIETRKRKEREADSRYFDDVRESFELRYRAAWEARNWKALREAVEHGHAAFRPLQGKNYGTARQLITHCAARIRTGKPPKYPRRSQTVKGFAAHVSIERALHKRFDWLREMGATNPPPVARVKDWRGRKMRVSGAALRDFRCEWIPRVNAAGMVTPRTERVHARDLVEVMP